MLGEKVACATIFPHLYVLSYRAIDKCIAYNYIRVCGVPTCVCVCVCARARVRAYVRGCACGYMCVCVCVRARASRETSLSEQDFAL